MRTLSTPQDSINEFITRKLNPLLLVGDNFRFISAFLHAWWAVNSHASYLQNFCHFSFLEFDVNFFDVILSIQRYFSLTKYGEGIVKNLLLFMQSCKNVNLDSILVAATTNVFNFQIINSLMESWGVRSVLTSYRLQVY